MFAYVKAVSKMHKIACPKFTKWLRCVKFRIVGANNGAGLLIFIVICDIMKIIMAETRPLTKKIDDKNYLEYIQTERIWKNQYGNHK